MSKFLDKVTARCEDGKERIVNRLAHNPNKGVCYMTVKGEKQRCVTGNLLATEDGMKFFETIHERKLHAYRRLTDG
jgi:hypothetical protein